jgi:hypothetical protein
MKKKATKMDRKFLEPRRGGRKRGGKKKRIPDNPNAENKVEKNQISFCGE